MFGRRILLLALILFALWTLGCAPEAQLTLNHSTVDIALGGPPVKLEATLYPHKGEDVIWTTDNASIISVSNDGLVVPVAVGSAKVYATTKRGTVTAECTVTVLGFPDVDFRNIRVVLLHDMTLAEGEVIKVAMTDFLGKPIKTDLTLQSSDPAAAFVERVEGGFIIRALAKGHTVISVTTPESTQTRTCSVTVVGPPPFPTSFINAAVDDSATMLTPNLLSLYRRSGYWELYEVLPCSATSAIYSLELARKPNIVHAPLRDYVIAELWFKAGSSILDGLYLVDAQNKTKHRLDAFTGHRVEFAPSADLVAFYPWAASEGEPVSLVVTRIDQGGDSEVQQSLQLAATRIERAAFVSSEMLAVVVQHKTSDWDVLRELITWDLKTNTVAVSGQLTQHELDIVISPCKKLWALSHMGDKWALWSPEDARLDWYSLTDGDYVDHFVWSNNSEALLVWFGLANASAGFALCEINEDGVAHATPADALANYSWGENNRYWSPVAAQVFSPYLEACQYVDWANALRYAFYTSDWVHVISDKLCYYDSSAKAIAIVHMPRRLP